MALSFRNLVGQNLRNTLVVDCANVGDITKTKSIFECMYPETMQVVAVNRCLTNNENPCGWEVIYDYRPETQKRCGPADANEAFRDILKFIPLNVSVKNNDKQVIGFPYKYRMQFAVDNCRCSKLDFELYYFMKNLKV